LAHTDSPCEFWQLMSELPVDNVPRSATPFCDHLGFPWKQTLSATRGRIPNES
jgi:hypothetical protein